jgi:hypothetical protein
MQSFENTKIYKSNPAFLEYVGFGFRGSKCRILQQLGKIVIGFAQLLRIFNRFYCVMKASVC